MKKFLLFAGDNYYPRGGWQDFQGSFDTSEEAQENKPFNCNWFHVIDSATGEMVYQGYNF